MFIREIKRCVRWTLIYPIAAIAFVLYIHSQAFRQLAEYFARATIRMDPNIDGEAG